MTRAALALLLLTGAAWGQSNHDRHHVHYQGWFNKLDTNCCNDQDCGELGEDDERTDGGRLIVKIEGTWCPVLSHHYLKRGNVPNASVAHVCVNKTKLPGQTPCDRLLCYQPRPGT